MLFLTDWGPGAKANRRTAVLEERERLARELHDSLTQSLYSLTLFAEAGREFARGGQWKRAGQHLAWVGEIAQQVLKEMRLLVYELWPPVLEQEGLVGALQQRLDAVEGRAGVQGRLLAAEVPRLPIAVEQGLYRIAQEALNYALKHALASSVTVHLDSKGEGTVRRVSLEVVDDGVGFDPEAVRDKGGAGLINMRVRAEELGGALVIRSTPGKGARVKVEIDVQQQPGAVEEGSR